MAKAALIRDWSNDEQFERPLRRTPIKPESRSTSKNFWNELKQLKEKEDYPFENSEEQEETWRKDKVGDDLDVPGADLDDDMENIGEEDEENNVYSLGGDRHEDLEDDNGEFLDFEDDDRELDSE